MKSKIVLGLLGLSVLLLGKPLSTYKGYALASEPSTYSVMKMVYPLGSQKTPEKRYFKNNNYNFAIDFPPSWKVEELQPAPTVKYYVMAKNENGFNISVLVAFPIPIKTRDIEKVYSLEKDIISPIVQFTTDKVLDSKIIYINGQKFYYTKTMMDFQDKKLLLETLYTVCGLNMYTIIAGVGGDTEREAIDNFEPLKTTIQNSFQSFKIWEN